MGGEEFDDLREFDDGGSGDGGDTEGFGEGEFQAWRVGYVDVENKGFVAVRADEGEAEVADRAREGMCHWLEGGAKGVHDRRWVSITRVDEGGGGNKSTIVQL